MQALYIGISVTALIAILALLFLNRGKSRHISTLTMLGMTMVVLGVIFEDSGWIIYAFMGVGALLMIIDAKYIKSREET